MGVGMSSRKTFKNEGRNDLAVTEWHNSRTRRRRRSTSGGGHTRKTLREKKRPGTAISDVFMAHVSHKRAPVSIYDSRLWPGAARQGVEDIRADAVARRHPSAAGDYEPVPETPKLPLYKRPTTRERVRACVCSSLWPPPPINHQQSKVFKRGIVPKLFPSVDAPSQATELPSTMRGIAGVRGGPTLANQERHRECNESWGPSICPSALPTVNAYTPPPPPTPLAPPTPAPAPARIS